MSSIKDEIRQLICSKYLRGEAGHTVHDDTPLQTSGLLDSLAVIGLVADLERHFKIRLTVAETSSEKFDRLEDIAALVMRKNAA
jgi:acyl carrier protein